MEGPTSLGIFNQRLLSSSSPPVVTYSKDFDDSFVRLKHVLKNLVDGSTSSTFGNFLMPATAYHTCCFTLGSAAGDKSRCL